MGQRLFEGVRVIDFTDFLAGPYCGMYFADNGAEVLKFENLATGGNFVRNGVPKEPKEGVSMYFQNLNRNKRGIALNLKTEEGKKLFAELVKSADVLIENNRPGVMDRLGFGWEHCHELNPRLIYASISGYGQYGARAKRPGYDLIAQALGGSMSITGWPDDQPTRAGMAIGDLLAGINCAFAVAGSLFKRIATGEGQRIDVALVDSVVSAMEAKLMQYIYTGVCPTRTGNEYLTSAPYDSFKAKDNYFVLASGTDAHFKKLCTVLNRPDLPDNPLYVDTPKRRANAAGLKKIIETWAADKTVDEVVKLIDSVGVPVGPIYDCKDIANDKEITDVRQMFVKVPHPTLGNLTVLGNPIKMSEYPWQYDTCAPELGADNKDVFEKLGFSEEELKTYEAAGALNLSPVCKK